jgi:ATP-binding cassette, subfamily C, bacterial CydD
VKAVDPRLFRQAGPARAYLIAAITLGLAGAVLILVQADMLSRLLAGAGRGTGVAALAGTLAWLGAVLAGRAAAAAGAEAAALRSAAVVKSRLRRRLSAHALTLGPAWLTGQQAGEITTLATQGLDALDAYFARYLPQLVLAVAVPVAVLARVAAADWLSAVIIAATLPLIPLFAVLIGWHTQAQTRKQWLLLGRLGGHFLDVVAGLPTLKLFGRAKAQADVIEEVTGKHRAATMATLRVAFLSALVLEITAALATALVAVEIGLRLLAGHVSYQTALLVLLLTPEAYLPLRNAGAQFHASTEGTAAARRAFEILDTPPLPGQDVPAPGTPVSGAVSATPVAATPVAAASADANREDIVFEGVTVAYPGRSRPALDDVSLTIRPGDYVVVTGASGAGKSSLLAVLLRFATPASGTVSIGGADLARIPADHWRQQIAWVPQQPHLFAATVAGNIALGQPDARRQDVVAAARLAGADEFIRRLDHGYDTVLTEGGRTLSAGQRQKLALARAFLRQAPILLLDEPTAHLDSASSRHLLNVIQTGPAGRTVVLVTHQPLPPAARTTRLLALDQGRLIQQAAAVLA